MNVYKNDFSIDLSGWAEDVGNLLKYKEIQLLSKIDFYNGFKYGVINTAEKYEEKIRELNKKISDLNIKCNQLEIECDEKEEYNMETMRLRIKQLLNDFIDNIDEI